MPRRNRPRVSRHAHEASARTRPRLHRQPRHRPYIDHGRAAAHRLPRVPTTPARRDAKAKSARASSITPASAAISIGSPCKPAQNQGGPQDSSTHNRSVGGYRLARFAEHDEFKYPRRMPYFASTISFTVLEVPPSGGGLKTCTATARSPMIPTFWTGPGAK